MSQDLSEEVKEYIAKLEEHIKSAENRKKYSLERFDILVISLSSGGLAMSLSIYSSFPKLPLYSIKAAWIGFSLALIINLTSQCTGFFANKYDIECTQLIIDEEKKGIETNQKECLDKKTKKFTTATSWLNGAAFISLILAVIFVVIFITFKY